MKRLILILSIVLLLVAGVMAHPPAPPHPFGTPVLTYVRPTQVRATATVTNRQTPQPRPTVVILFTPTSTKTCNPPPGCDPNKQACEMVCYP